MCYLFNDQSIRFGGDFIDFEQRDEFLHFLRCGFILRRLRFGLLGTWFMREAFSEHCGLWVEGWVGGLDGRWSGDTLD